MVTTAEKTKRWLHHSDHWPRCRRQVSGGELPEIYNALKIKGTNPAGKKFPSPAKYNNCWAILKFGPWP
jgi:hypothetical protein